MLQIGEVWSALYLGEDFDKGFTSRRCQYRWEGYAVIVGELPNLNEEGSVEVLFCEIHEPFASASRDRADQHVELASSGGGDGTVL